MPGDEKSNVRTTFSIPELLGIAGTLYIGSRLLSAGGKSPYEKGMYNQPIYMMPPYQYPQQQKQKEKKKKTASKKENKMLTKQAQKFVGGIVKVAQATAYRSPVKSVPFWYGYYMTKAAEGFGPDPDSDFDDLFQKIKSLPENVQKFYRGFMESRNPAEEKALGALQEKIRQDEALGDAMRAIEQHRREGGAPSEPGMMEYLSGLGGDIKEHVGEHPWKYGLGAGALGLGIPAAYMAMSGDDEEKKKKKKKRAY